MRAVDDRTTATKFGEATSTVRVIRQSAAYGNPRVYGQESGPLAKDHWEDEKNSAPHPEGTFGETHKVCRRRSPPEGSKTQDDISNGKSACRQIAVKGRW